MKASFLLTTFAALCLGFTSLFAQITPTRVRTSPHETISAKIDNNRVIVVYGRPYSKDPKSGKLRPIWGNLVPTDAVWRAGADEATLLITQQSITLGGTKLAAGAYSLYFLLGKDGNASLLVNRQIGQWGAEPYPENGEVARIPLTKTALESSVDQFTMGLEKDPAGGGVLKLVWETTQFSALYSVSK